MIAYSGDQRSSAVISGHQRSSGVIRGHQRSSEVIRGCQSGKPRLLKVIRGSSEVLRRECCHIWQPTCVRRSMLEYRYGADRP